MSENGEVDGMRIVQMKARNVKRLRAIGIEPDPDSGAVVISGANNQGKSSVLDAIYEEAVQVAAVACRIATEGDADFDEWEGC